MFFGMFPFMQFLQNPAVAFPEQYTIIETMGTMWAKIKEQQKEIDELKAKVNGDNNG